MGFDVISAYVVGIVGLVLAIIVAWITNSTDINTQLAIDVLLRCLREGNVDRARKLCMAAPKSFFDAIGNAIIAGTTVASRDRTVIESVVFPAFEETKKQLLATRKAGMELGVVGIFLVVVSIGLVAQSESSFPIAILVIGGLGALVAVFLWRRNPRLADALARARAEVLPVLVTALVGNDETARDDGPFRTASKPTSPPPPPRAAEPPPIKAIPEAQGPSLRDGACPLCSHTEIARVDLDDLRFHKLVCKKCGYTQEFADLSQIE